MNYLTCFVVLSIASIALSFPQGQYGPPAVQQYGQEGGMPYNFDYSVNDALSGNNFGHKENSDGNVVQGIYYVLLPDGRTQTVKYNVAGDSGFVADVQYEGEASSYGGSQGSQGGYN